MIDRDKLTAAVARSVSFGFSRSGGKGGQNVNKLNTKVTALIDLDDLPLLTPVQKERIRTVLKHRFSRTGKLQVQVQDERSRARNLHLAVMRLVELILCAARLRKKRTPTRIPAGAHERRLAEKKKHTEKKRLRRSYGTEAEQP